MVVYGPPATGKTLNSESLRNHFRCRAVMDDGHSLPRELLGQTGRVLILSTTDKVRDPYDRRRVLKSRTVKIEDAAKALGAKWITPRHANVTSVFRIASANAKRVLKAGDRIRVTKCPGTKRVITFAGWDGDWIVSKSGINDYAASCVDMVNGESVNFCAQSVPSHQSHPKKA